MVFNIFDVPGVPTGHEVDSNAFPSPPSASANAVQISVNALWHIEVHDGAYLLNIDASSGDVGGDEDTLASALERLIACNTVFLFHVAVDLANRKVLSGHGIIQVAYPFNAIAVDDALTHGNGSVQVPQRIEFLVVAVKSNIELLNSFQSELFRLYKNLDRIAHELLC